MLDRPSTFRRAHPFVLGMAFLSTYYVALLGPILPAIAEPMGGTALSLGVLFSAYSLAQFVSAPFLGALGDRFGRRVVMLGSIGGALIGFLIFTVGAILGVGLWVLFVGWMIVGACDCWLATAFSYVADTTELTQRTRFFAYVTAAIGSAFIVGPLTSGVFGAVSPVLPLYVLLAAFTAALAIGVFSMPETLPLEMRASSLTATQLNPLIQIRDILRLPHLRLLLVSFFLYWPSTLALTTNLPVLLNERVDWGAGRISGLLLLYGVLLVLVQLVVIPNVAGRISEMHVAVAGAAVSAAAFVVLAFFASTLWIPLVYVGTVLFGIGQPLVQTSITATVSKSVTVDMQGRAQGALASTMAMAQVVGPILIGWLYVAGGPAFPYWTIVAQILIALGVMLFAIPRLASRL